MSISPITRKSQEFESNRCEKQCDKVSDNEALALIPTIDQKWHEVLKPEISTNEPSDLNTQFSFLEAPAEIKWLILRNLDLPTLVRLSATGKHLYNFVWGSIPRLIGCPIRYDAPIYEQVLSFILDLQKKIANIRERSDDITQIFERPTIDQINHLQKWLTATKILSNWGLLTLVVSIQIPGLNIEGPGLSALEPSHTVIARAEEFNEWFKINQKLLQARDALVVWQVLASILGVPGPGNLNNEDAVIDKASEFSAWFHANRDALVQLTELNLSGAHLTSLPSEIGELTQLRKLDLYANNFSSLPDEFCNLTKLVSLSLFNNHLNSLPDGFGNLTQLQELDVSGNRLTALPNISNLTHLEDLSIGYNRLTSLPNISNLTQLQELDVSGNRLTSLPDEFSNLTHLLRLSLCKNQFSSFPREVCNLAQLRELYLEGSQFSSLPDEFSNLTHLERLSLDHNRLTSLPKGFGDLALLSWLSLENNQFSSLPDEFCNLTRLKHLFLKNNRLNSLPDGFGNLALLTWLKFEGNPFSLSSRVMANAHVTKNRAIESIYKTVKKNGRKVAVTAVALSALELGAYLLGYGSPIVSTAAFAYGGGKQISSGISAGINTLYFRIVSILTLQ